MFWGQTFLTNWRLERSTNICIQRGKGANILHLGGQIIDVGVGVFYEDVEVEAETFKHSLMMNI